MFAIEASSLSKIFGDNYAVKNLSFQVPEGSIYGFLGQNGSGKSTTIRMLLSLVHPSSGDIELFGKKLQAHRKEIMSKIGAVIERPDLYPYLSANEHLKYFGRLSGLKNSKQRIDAILRKVGLDQRKNDKVSNYSLGMKQRLGIGIALLNDPDLIILDEPTNGLDPNGIADIRTLIKDLAANEGKTIFISSHLLSEIEQIADRILIIHKGEKLAEGTLKSLFDPEKVMVNLDTVDNQKTLEILSDSIYKQYIINPGFLSLELPLNILPDLHQFLVNAQIGVLTVEKKNTLEDHFLRLTSTITV